MAKGGSQSTSVTVPAWLEDAAKQNLAKAGSLAQIGYTPYYGADVAALTPTQIASMQGTNQAASAFGMPTADPTAGMPQAQNFGGVQGYSSGGMYDQALAELKSRAPGQFAALQAPFINPVTGALPTTPYGTVGAGAPGGAGGGSTGGGVTPANPYQRDDRDTTRGGGATTPNSGGGLLGGYTGIRDMINGGGPGQSGDKFSGGGLVSGGLNMAGVNPVGRAAAGPVPRMDAGGMGKAK